MKRAIFLLFLVVGLTTSAIAQHPVIQQIIDNVSLDSMMLYAEEITGERPITVNGVTDSIMSRHKNNPGNALCVDYLEMKLIQFGLAPIRQQFSATGENIYAEITGTLYPNQKYVLCAHFDAMPGSGPAPAADDDGSGTAALIEAARILAQYEFEYTIVLGWWDEEEQGLVGSDEYAAFAAANNDSLLGVINMDAIAWDGDGDDLMRVHTNATANSVALADTVVAINSTYNIGLNIAINNPGATYSDHASFWSHGFSAVLIIEDFDNDGNPYYHTPNDLVQYLDQPYFEMMAKLSFASLASCAVPYDPLSGIGQNGGERHYVQVYPNPFALAVNISVELEKAGEVEVVITNPLGQVVDRLNVGEKIVGKHLIRWQNGTVADGLYHIAVLRNGEAIGSAKTVLKAN
jgi:hypothetical protein